MHETILETKICKQCGQSFSITDKDREFYDTMEVPAPTLCPQDRERRRLSFRGKNFYLKTCDKCGKTKMAWFSPQNHFVQTYCDECFRDDSFDAMKYGREFDFTQPFFSQFFDLYYQVPKHMSNVLNNENCEYIISAHNNKNCYMADEIDDSRDSYFCFTCQRSKDIVDGLYVNDSEIGYSVIKMEDSFKVFFSKNIFNCASSAFLENCRGCSNCLFCANLENGSYQIFNKPVSKEEFTAQRNQIFSGKRSSIETAKETFETFLKKQAVPSNILINTDHCSGNYITNSKQAHECFCADYLEDCKFCADLHKSKQCYDINFYEGEHSYEGNHIGPEAYKNRFCQLTQFSKDVDYCMELHSCRNCFGCAGLKNKEYCVLNKQYTKEEYETLVPKIIEHMKASQERGEFFPTTYSPQPYNHTFAQQFYPLTKEEVLQQEWKWIDDEDMYSQDSGTIEFPEDINNLPENILSSIFICTESGKKFKYIAQEIAFYQRYQLPLPTKHPVVRIANLWKELGSRTLVEYKCDNCGAQILTSPDIIGKRIIYCEDCYKKTLY